MAIKLKKGAKYALAVPTSMGIRLTPQGRQPVHQSSNFTAQVTSAETNVASVASYLGLPVKVLTAFVAASPIAKMIKADLASRNMDFEGPEVPQGGPWGYRHQINIADSGFGPRGPRVANDRAGEVGRKIATSDFDLERIFGQEGASILHMSGLIAALSKSTTGLCLDLARAAKKYGTAVSFDLNYRASFWKGREGELGEKFSEIASLSDILAGNEEDFQLCLGIPGPREGGEGLSSKIEAFKDMIGRVREKYPSASVFATTLREVASANTHLWGAVMAEGDRWHIIEPRPIEVADRIGGGDGFVGGMLYGMLSGWEPEKWIQFGWANGAFVATLNIDYSNPADEEQIWAIWEGNARVKR